MTMVMVVTVAMVAMAMVLCTSAITMPASALSVRASSSPSRAHSPPSMTPTYDNVRGAPYTVSYDSRALLINGQRVLLHSGSIHYPRSTPAMWPGLLNLTKAAGINTVEIYVFWDLHEAQPGVYDFETFNRNLPLFLQLVGDAGLFAFLRIGPYVCAEWNWGAMPLWIHQQSIVVRSMDSRWLTYMESFVRKVVNVTEPYLARNGGPVILAQIENEYGNIESSYPDGPQYVQWCSNLTVALNVSIPWVMCQQSDAPDYIINSCNGFYCDNFVASHASRNQPAIWSEAYPGWFQAWGEAKPARPAQDMAFAVARWIARGGALHNYYMWHGGTSFGRHVGGPLMITSYDYNAPLDEYGVPNPTNYPHLSALHHISNQYASVIINNPIPTPMTPCGACEIHVYGTASDGGIAFLSNFDDSNAYNMSVDSATFEVPAWTVLFVDLATLQIVYRTDVLPTNSKNGASGAASPADRNGTVIAKPTDFAYFTEPIGLYDPSNAISAYGPQDQIDVAAPTSDYLWYVTYVQLTAAQISNGKVHLSLANCGDLQYVFFNGVHMGDAQEVDISVAGLQVGVQYALQVLSVTLGIQNYGSYLNEATRGLVGTVTLDGVDLKQQEWYHQVGLQGESLELYTPMGALSNVWQQASPTMPVNTDRVWYRFTLTATSISPPSGNAPYPTFMLDTLALGKGLIWVNGFNLGRYWDVQAPQTCASCVWQGSFSADKCRFDCGQQSQRYLHVPAEVLAPQGQSNVVVMFAERGGDPSAVVLLQRD